MKYVIYVEGWGAFCRELNFGDDVFVKCFNGSKRHALKYYGVPDDDLDFAMRFLDTCWRHRARACIAVVRDPRILYLLRDLLSTRFRSIARRVHIIKVPFTSKPEIMREVKSEIYEVIRW